MKLYAVILALALGARAAQQDRDAGSWQTQITHGPDDSPASSAAALETRRPDINPLPWYPTYEPPLPLATWLPSSRGDSVLRDIPEDPNPSEIPTIPAPVPPFPPLPPFPPRPKADNPLARAVAATKVLWNTPPGWYADTESTGTMTASEAEDIPANPTLADPTLAGAASLSVAPAALVLAVAAWLL
ncbi:hypothetical protein DL766_004954 [Monosporascus sp. MC13-8B]|uniref:Uncharacterized protein n=1 Tax=Monosporascus cannonballus TaxID=155416 RepID=A0ABY0H5A8_9PEZI|nr:hypothetical protein DL762_006377 [Monosporascus cannonballus]RYO97014.1 hypothetical protein DL763_002951 [Monosporascus cannonballus]RYP30282.1 hypothetical protein DL766_004954 [Monosporascus sp. MC13-8B]